VTRNLFKWLLVLIACVHGFTLTARAQAGDANPPAPSGVITGHVTNTNGEIPNNATAYASASSSLMGPPRSTPVNNDGNFKFEGLEVGVYRVWTGAPGFVADAPGSTDGRGFVHTGESANLRLRKGGVITGTVLNSNNTPVVGASVRALRIRDEAGKPIETVSSFNERFTDDRGVYRIYGLMPGTYVVAAGGVSRMYGGYANTGYDQDVPTYAPSSTRDTAMEITVRSGEEATADVQYRGEPGHAISGTVTGVAQTSGGIISSASITVMDVKTHTVVMNSNASSYNGFGFAVFGLADGEYELVAQNFSPQTRDIATSQAKRIKVQGADIGGVTLTVAPLPAISGRVMLDNATSDCGKRRETVLQETIIFGQREKQTAKSADAKTNSTTEQVPLIFATQNADTVADAKGDFVLRNLHAGTYRLSITPPNAGWYVKSITMGVNPRNADSRLISDGITLNSQSVSGINVTIAEGAAFVRGTIVTAEGKPVRDRMLVYFVPAEKESASNLLRYFEVRSEADGAFELRNVPPGEYLLMAQSADENRSAGVLIRQDSALRAGVVRDAQKLNRSITLKPCERNDKFELPYQITLKP
jgi:hypothetical protein